MSQLSNVKTLIRRRNSQEEAALWLSLMPTWTERDHLVILGLGEGHHVREVIKKGGYASLQLVDINISRCADLPGDRHQVQELGRNDLPLPILVLPFRPAWQGHEASYRDCFLRITGRSDRTLRSEFSLDAREEALRQILQELVK